MTELTLDELNSVNPEKIYDLPLTLNLNLWKTIKLKSKLPKPIKLEFNDGIRNKMINPVKNGKGIYMFFAEPDFPFEPKVNYLLYVGRVMKTNTFFKRFYDYVGGIGNYNIQRNKQLLVNAWPKYTYVYFYKLTNDKDIEEIEQELIDKIIPPLNNKFYLKSAQNTRSLYN